MNILKSISESNQRIEIEKYFRNLGLRVSETEKGLELSYITTRKKCGKISNGIIEVGNNIEEDHLEFEIDTDIRGLGIGKKLFELYQLIYGEVKREVCDNKTVTFFLSIGFRVIDILEKRTGNISEYIGDIEYLVKEGGRNYVYELVKK